MRPPRASILSVPIFLLAWQLGCVPAEVQVSATASAPELALVAPGVWVVQDSPWATYYYDGFYWRYDGGIWYRSGYYDSGFARIGVTVLPPAVIRIHRPRAYVRYRAPRGAQVRRADRRHDSRHDRRRHR